MLNFIRDLGSRAYTGLDTALGGILPAGQDISQGYLADIGRTALDLGRNILPQNNITASPSIADTQSIQPVLEDEGISLQEAFSQPLQLGEDTGTMGLQEAFSTPIDTGTQGLFEVFGDGGGGFIPPGITSEAEMVELGIGDGWTPNTIYESETKTLSGLGGAGSGGGRVRVTDYTNGNYGVYMENYETGEIETFIQKGTTGREGIDNYETNFVRTESNMTAPTPRINGIDLSGLIGASVADPSATLQKSTQPITVKQFFSSAPLPGMERIDTLNDADLVSEIDIRELPGMTNSQGNDPFSQRVLDTIDIIESNATGEEIASNPYVQELKDGKSFEEVFGILPGINDEEVVVNDLSDPIDDNSTMGLENAFSTGGLADGNQTATTTTNNINPDNTGPGIKIPEMDKISGVDNTQGSLSSNTNAPGQGFYGTTINGNKVNTSGYEINGNVVDKETWAKYFKPDGTLFSGVTQEELLKEFPMNKPQQDSHLNKFHEFMETQALYEEMRRKPNEGGDTPKTEFFDIVSPETLNDLKDQYVEAGKEAGLKQDQLDKLQGAGTWDDLKETANDAFDLNAPGTIKGLAKVLKKTWNLLSGKSLKKIDEARQTHNINMQEQKSIRPELEEKLKEQRSLGQDIESLEDLNLSGYALQMSIRDAINNSTDIDEKMDLSKTLAELQGAEMLGMDIALIDEDDFSLSLARQENESGQIVSYNNPFSITTREQDESMDSVSSPSSYMSGKLANYENPFNPSDDPFKQPALAEGGENQEGWDIETGGEDQYADDTTRDPQSWGVINENGDAVAQWNPFAKESEQEEVARDVVNPNRSVSDGYSSPTMATIDRNIRPTLDRVGDILEYPLEAAGLGMYNTIGQLPLVGGIGKSVGNSLARAGQGIDRAIDTKLPDSLFKLNTGDDGDGNDSKMSKEEMDQLREWTEIYGPGNSPLVEHIRDKYFYGYGNGSDGSSGPGTPGYYMNSVSDPSMSIYGGSGSGIASTGGVPGGVGGMGQSGSGLDGISSMADGFDLSTPEGQAKYADLYGEDRLADELSKRGLFDRRAAEADEGNPEQGEAYAGIANENYRLKEHFEKPKQNIGEEIAKGINQAQEKEGVFA